MPKIGPETTGGSLVAYDPVTQKERWHAEGGGGIGGGTVTTAGNLVIQVLNTGKLRAYTADKGEKLLDIDTPARNGMGPPITFMLDGKQYIALNGGTGQFAGAGRGGPAAPPPAPNAPPPAPAAKPQLMVFMVDGKVTASSLKFPTIIFAISPIASSTSSLTSLSTPTVIYGNNFQTRNWNGPLRP